MDEDTIYTTADGDMIDWVCWRFYGRTRDVVELVLEANPGLADKGPVLSMGERIVLPAIPPPSSTRVQRIWS